MSQRNEVEAIEVKKIILELLHNLPDNKFFGDESWGWAWRELSGNAQESIKEVRKKANEFMRSRGINNPR